MVRVVDARAVNGHFWVEYGSLSNVDFTVTVTDVATGAVKAYHNPAGSFASLRDDEAFAEAPAVQTGVSPGPPPSPQTAAAHCTPSATVLCVLNRFAVQVSFIDPDTGASKSAQAVAVTGSTGVFGFNSVEDSEVMVKVLDARAVNHLFWVFFGALSDLEYTVTVTDNVNHVRGRTTTQRTTWRASRIRGRSGHGRCRVTDGAEGTERTGTKDIKDIQGPGTKGPWPSCFPEVP